MISSDYYKVLGVDRKATRDEIKAAYRRKAQKMAPRTDKECNDPERSQALVALNKAYETLSDPAKREYYDLHGEDAKLSTIEQQAMQIIYGILTSLAEQTDEGDFVTAIKENLRNNVSGLKRARPDMEKKITRTERQRKCIRRKHGKENLLDRFFQQRLDALKAKIAELPEAIALGEKALEIMDDYENAFTGTTARQPVGLEALFLGIQRGRGF